MCELELWMSLQSVHLIVSKIFGFSFLFSSEFFYLLFYFILFYFILFYFILFSFFILKKDDIFPPDP